MLFCIFIYLLLSCGSSCCCCCCYRSRHSDNNETRATSLTAKYVFGSIFYSLSLSLYPRLSHFSSLNRAAFLIAFTCIRFWKRSCLFLNDGNDKQQPHSHSHSHTWELSSFVCLNINECCLLLLLLLLLLVFGVSILQTTLGFSITNTKFTNEIFRFCSCCFCCCLNGFHFILNFCVVLFFS